MEAAAGSALAEGATASASACGADDRPHGSQTNTRPSDEDGLLEGLEGGRGAVLQTVYFSVIDTDGGQSRVRVSSNKPPQEGRSRRFTLI